MRKEDQPLVSVIMPSYNSARFVSEAIKSVMNQTYQNWELLITDDCSKDNSVEVINKYTAQDSRVKLEALKKNVGAASARNISLEKAKGEYIAFLDSDDTWNLDKLEYQIDFMRKRNLPFTFSNYEIMEENGDKQNKIISVPTELSYKQYLKNTIIGCLTVVINRKIVGDFQMPLIKSSHDMALWLLIMKRGFHAYGIKKCLASYRLVSTSNTSQKRKAAKDVWKVYREIEHLSLIYSTYCFLGYAINATIKRL